MGDTTRNAPHHHANRRRNSGHEHLRMDTDTPLGTTSTRRSPRGQSGTQLGPLRRRLHPPPRWTHHPSNPLGSLTHGPPLHRWLRPRTVRRRKPPLPVTPYSKYSQYSMCSSRTPITCAQRQDGHNRPVLTPHRQARRSPRHAVPKTPTKNPSAPQPGT